MSWSAIFISFLIVKCVFSYEASVLRTEAQQLIYNDEQMITIRGTNFSPHRNALQFYNGLENSIDYSTLFTNTSLIKLQIKPPSLWIKKSEGLPSCLNIVSIDNGNGVKYVGDSVEGVYIASVFERPIPRPSRTKLSRTHAREFHIKGIGFHVNEMFPIVLKFEPPLVLGLDYHLRRVSDVEIQLNLIPGRAWRENAGELRLVAINTRGDEAGWVILPRKGVLVADIVEDPAASGGVEVFPNQYFKVYQSALQQEIQMIGTGFQKDMVFSFEPELVLGVDYNMEVKNSNQITLNLAPGKKWRGDAAGNIIVKSVVISGAEYILADGEGVRIATVLMDPVIFSSKDVYRESQSKLVFIRGSGFSSDVKVSFRPTRQDAYEVLGGLNSTFLQVKLKPNKSWLPSYLSLTREPDEKKRIALQVASIDTGAGEISFKEPITVGYIVKDKEGMVCNDTCEFAFDGVCDDRPDFTSLEEYSKRDRSLDPSIGTSHSRKHHSSSNSVSSSDNSNEDGSSSGRSLRRNEGHNKDTHDYAYANEYANEYEYSHSSGDDDYAVYEKGNSERVNACLIGTDCTDCGGVDAVWATRKPTEPSVSETPKVSACTNNCVYARDGECDDTRGTKYCALGTDCQDCGPVGSDNFTRSNDDHFWGDDNWPGVDKQDNFGEFLDAGPWKPDTTSNSPHHKNSFERNHLVVVLIFLLIFATLYFVAKKVIVN